MNLRYLPDSADGPVVLLEDADPSSARAIMTALEDLATGQRSAVHFHKIPGIEPIDGCQLIALASDAAEESRPEPGRVVWGLRRVQWQSVIGLIEPFAAASKPVGHLHQYLGEAGLTTVIISTSDHW